MKSVIQELLILLAIFLTFFGAIAQKQSGSASPAAATLESRADLHAEAQRAMF